MAFRFAGALRFAGARFAAALRFAGALRAVVFLAGAAFRAVRLFAGGTVTYLSLVDGTQVSANGDLLLHGGLELGARRELDALGRGDLHDLTGTRVTTLTRGTL